MLRLVQKRQVFIDHGGVPAGEELRLSILIIKLVFCVDII
jgi:hypothetical protein